MSNIKQHLPPRSSSSRLILDGGLSTELERSYNCDLSTSKLWSAILLKDQDKGCNAIRSVHLDFLRSGAEIICTSGYQATVEGFVLIGNTKEEASELLCRSVRLACEARATFLAERNETEPTESTRGPPYVAVSLGCYGATLADGSEFTGSYPPHADEDFLLKFHRDRIDVYRNGGVLGPENGGADVLAFETVPCSLEARAIARLMREEGGKLPPFWVSFSGSSRDNCSSGEPMTECFRPLIEPDVVPGLLALGLNCTHPDFVFGLLRSGAAFLKNHPDAKERVALIAYPNLGEEWDAVSRGWKKETGLNIHSFGAHVGTWVRNVEHQGVSVGIVGGCCRSTPEMIAGLKEFLDSVDEQAHQ